LGIMSECSLRYYYTVIQTAFGSKMELDRLRARKVYITGFGVRNPVGGLI